VDLKEGKILITGASGSLGKQLIFELIKRDIKPVLQVRESSDTRYLDTLDLETRVADLRDSERLAELVEGIDGIIHTAAWVNFRCDRSDEFIAINTKAACDLFQAASKAGVRRFVHVSTVAAIGATLRTQKPKDRTVGRTLRVNEASEYNLGHLNIPYIRSKHAAEKKLAELAAGSDTELVTVNPSIVIAPSRTGDDRGKARKALVPVLPSFLNWVNLVDIRDVAPGVLAAFERGKTGERYILAGDDMTARDLLLTVSSIVGRWPHLATFSRWPFNLAARLSLAWSKMRGGKISFYPNIVRLLDYDWSYSSLKARADLGFKSRSLQVSLNDLLTNNFRGTWLKP